MCPTGQSQITASPASQKNLQIASAPSGVTFQPEQTKSYGQELSRGSSDTTRSQMSQRNVHTDIDEITPIRQAVEIDARSYDTNERPSPASNTESNDQPAHGPTDRTRNNVVDEVDASRKEKSWLKSIVARYGSISLENKGSVARDHLALERTFLAWLRTSLAFASIGIAITQLFRLNTSISDHARSISKASSAATAVPYSPFVGYSIPADLAPYLQEIVASQSSKAIPTLGPTLFDQLFMLDAKGNSITQATISLQDLSNNEGTETKVDESKIRQLGKPLGATFIGISILILLVGFHRYFESQYWIVRGKFPASRASIALVGFITSALIVASLVVVVVVHPTHYERKK